MSNTVTRRRVELSEGQIIIRRIVVETDDRQPMCNASGSTQAVVSDPPVYAARDDRSRRNITRWWRRQH